MQLKSATTSTQPSTYEQLNQERIETEVFGDFGEPASMQQEWDSFVESVGGEIFLTYDWCRLWWKHYGDRRELKIFIFRQKGRLVGIMPMFFEKIWLGPFFVRAGKIVGTDFTPVAVSLPVEKKFLPEVTKAFLTKLTAECNWDIIHIGPLAGLFSGFDNLMSACKQYFGSTGEIKSNNKSVQTYFKLAGNWESQLAGLCKNERGDIRRNYRNIQKIIGQENRPIIAKFVSAENPEKVFNDFVQMHQRRWRQTGESGHFADWPGSEHFHREAALVQQRYGRLRLLTIKIAEHNIGCEYAYRFGDKYFEFLNARTDSKQFEHISIGKLVFSELVKKALQEDVRCIDSMRGRYEHKLRLGGAIFPIRNIHICWRKLSAQVRIRIFRVLCRLLTVCYYKIWFCRIAPRLPVKRGQLWKIWIRTQMFS